MKMFFKYILFGIIDNGVILIFGLIGISLEKQIENFINFLLKKSSFQIKILSSVKFALFTAMVANAISDFAGGLGVNWGCSWGTFLGCLMIAILLIPFTFKKIRRI